MQDEGGTHMKKAVCSSAVMLACLIACGSLAWASPQNETFYISGKSVFPDKGTQQATS